MEPAYGKITMCGLN